MATHSAKLKVGALSRKGYKQRCQVGFQCVKQRNQKQLSNRSKRRKPFVPVATRAPSDYPWVVLGEVCVALSDWLSSASITFGQSAARRRDPSYYFDAGESFGLQSINRMSEKPMLEASVDRLVSSLIAKHESVTLSSPKEKRDKCISDVISLDSSLKNPSESVRNDVVFAEIRRQVSKLLGPCPKIEEISESCRHGPGSSTDQDYSHRSRYFKYRDWPYSCSPGAGDLLRAVIALDPRWVGALEDSYRTRYRVPPWAVLDWTTFWKNVVRDEVPFNVITAVPKDGKKDRPIAIEPPGNVYLQLGFDGLIRDRLRRAGNSIDNQDRNRRLALEGSIDGSLATIDLTNASDTLHLELIKELFPSDWFDMLCRIRSPYGLLPDGRAWRYAKFSSMGNATTFVLETVVFWATAKAISKLYGDSSDTISVFGDDIIVPCYLYRHVVIWLELLGCQANKAKSFADGSIRESCGVDARSGTDIRPVFLKRHPATDLDIYSDRNRLHLWWRRHIGVDIPAALDQVFFKYLRLEPLFGPVTPEDTRSHLFDETFREHYYEAYAERQVELPAGDFLFRKLMHTLRGSSEGGMFAVSEASKRLSVVRLVSPLI